MAQRLAQATHNRLVVGSNPTGPTFNLQLGIFDFGLHRVWDEAFRLRCNRIFIKLTSQAFQAPIFHTQGTFPPCESIRNTNSSR